MNQLQCTDRRKWLNSDNRAQKWHRLQACRVRQCPMATDITASARNDYGLWPDPVIRALKVPPPIHVG